MASILVAFGLTAAACGGSDEATPDEDQSPVTTDSIAAEEADDVPSSDPIASDTTDEDVSESAVPSGEVVVGYVDTVDTLNPFPQGSGSIQFRLSLFDPLISIDDAGNPIGELAESWEFSDDGTNLVLNLRDGVVFHDGTPFDADVAVQNIELWKDPATNVQGANVWATVSASATDSSTVELTFERPVPEIFAVMNTALITKPGELDSGIGTGPFTLDSYTPREGLELSANTDYWSADGPRIASLELREFGDVAAASLSAQSGDIDILVGAQPSQIADLEGAGLTIISEPSSASLDILINATSVSDPAVRQALNMAFDRERLVDTVLLGFGTPQSSIYPPSSPVWAEQDAPLTEFDLDGAQALLDDAGIDSLDVTIMSPTILPLDQFMPIYQADLASIGVNLTIEPVDAATWGGAVSQPGAIPPMATHAYSFADLDPAMVFSAHPFRVGSNASGFESDEYAELVDNATAIIELEPRYEAFREVDQYISEQSFMFPVANPMANASTAPEVSGLEIERAGLDYAQVTVSE